MLIRVVKKRNLGMTEYIKIELIENDKGDD